MEKWREKGKKEGGGKEIEEGREGRIEQEELEKLEGGGEMMREKKKEEGGREIEEGRRGRREQEELRRKDEEEKWCEKEGKGKKENGKEEG